MSGWETRIYTGNPEADRYTVEQHRAAAASQGLGFQVQVLPAGGYVVRASPMAQGYPHAYAGYGAAPGGVVVGGGAATGAGAPALGEERVKYLRKVYGLLSISAMVAIVSGFLAVTAGPTTIFLTDEGHKVAVPLVVALMLSSRAVMYLAFGLLFVATLGASAVSRVRGLNLVALTLLHRIGYHH